jgi:hypothetical protein
MSELARLCRWMNRRVIQGRVERWSEELARAASGALWTAVSQRDLAAAGVESRPALRGYVRALAAGLVTQSRHEPLPPHGTDGGLLAAAEARAVARLVDSTVERLTAAGRAGLRRAA